MKLTQQATGPATSSGFPAFPSSQHIIHQARKYPSGLYGPLPRPVHARPGRPVVAPRHPCPRFTRPIFIGRVNRIHCETINPLIRILGEKPNSPHLVSVLTQAHLKFGDGRCEVMAVIGFSDRAGKLPQRHAKAHDTHPAPDDLPRP
jgi:hypothetical protein